MCGAGSEPVAIVDATMLLQADDFALDSHRRIYTAMLQLGEAGHTFAVDRNRGGDAGRR